MMQTHRDDEHLDSNLAEIFRRRETAFDRLMAEAQEAEQKGTASITAGSDGEAPIREWQKYGIHVRELPERDTDADLNIVRISLGGSFTEGFSYCVFRGPVGQVKDVLRRALNALG